MSRAASRAAAVGPVRGQLQRAAERARACLQEAAVRAPHAAILSAGLLLPASAHQLALVRSPRQLHPQPLFRTQLRGQTLQDQDGLQGGARPAVVRLPQAESLGDRQGH